MEIIQLSSLDLKDCAIVLNKADRVVEGINHGRSVYWDKKNKLYYKIFHRDYIRRENFITAYEAGFFDKLSSALVGLIYSGNEITGYVTKAGKLLSHSEFDFEVIPEGFLTLLKDTIISTNLFYYDFVPKNLHLLYLNEFFYLHNLYQVLMVYVEDTYYAFLITYSFLLTIFHSLILYPLLGYVHYDKMYH